ncbi:MAG: hypothetical protein LBV60_11390 [Streptomyces sp.]|jgi:hypothetical protein|nr:hypothetical protein [Streptomyces sp.]
MYGAFLAVPLWAVAMVVKLVSVVLPGRRPDWARDLMHWCAAMMGAAAVIIYVIGLGSVQWAANEAESGAGSSPAEPCRSLDSGTLDHLAGHEPSYFPLGFDCVLDDGSVVAGSGEYPWLNALAATFALAAVVLVLGVHLLDELRIRAGKKAHLAHASQGRT